MPKWGIEMQQGTVTGWHVAVGTATQKGEHLLDVETDKIVNSVESPAGGTLRLILAEAGATENVGALIGLIADASVSDPELREFVRGFQPADASFEPLDEPSSTTAPVLTASAQPDPNARPDPKADSSESEARVSPIARRIAERLGVDVTQVKGTGRGGRISKEDVEAFAAARDSAAARGAGGGGLPAGVRDSAEATVGAPARMRLSSMRAAIAKRLLESYQSIPHYRVSVDVDCEPMSARVAASRGSGDGVSINALVVRATALALRDHPQLNAHLVGDELLTYSAVDVCIAVAIESGLLTPVLRDAAAKTAAQIGAEIKALGLRARAGTLTREEITGGTFTISNLGMFGVDRFDAIINPPQVAILAVGAVSERVAIRDGSPVAAKMATFTLSADHRVIDGALASRFLASLKSLLHAPQSL
jgi:pyruvate dehydrogenase E2 component (dihydrolipoamide acetyltransferase)